MNLRRRIDAIARHLVPNPYTSNGPPPPDLESRIRSLLERASKPDADQLTRERAGRVTEILDRALQRQERAEALSEPWRSGKEECDGPE